MVKLRNGIEEYGPLVGIVLLCIEESMPRMPVAWIEAVALAKDRKHQILGGLEGVNAQELIEIRLIGVDGSMNPSIRHILDAAFEGNYPAFVRVDPCSADPDDDERCPF